MDAKTASYFYENGIAFNTALKLFPLPHVSETRQPLTHPDEDPQQAKP